MKRAVGSWRPRLALPTLHRGATQRRQKTMLPHQTEDEDKYYTINNQGPAPVRQPRNDELFEISNLLLDLDDVDSKHVRPFTEADEEFLKQKWEADPANAKVKARIEEMRRELTRSKLKAFEIMTWPVNPWRVTDHDILSVALRGAPDSTPLIDSNEESQQGNAVVLTASDALDPRKAPDLLHFICSGNGISNYAIDKDQLLMHWLQSRQKLAQHSSKEGQVHAQLTLTKVTDALKQQNAIAPIRRIVSQSLSSGLDATLLHSHPGDNDGLPRQSLSSEIRKACMSILEQLPAEDSSYLETLAFLGNIRQRLSLHDENIGGPLCGLGLRLSASIGNSDATLSYLTLGFKHNLWVGTEAMADILYTLEMYSHHLVTETSGVPFLGVADREMLLRLITGVEDEEGLSVESFRTLILSFIDDHGGQETQLVAGLYGAYLSALGRLGAVASLWKEWHLSKDGVESEKIKIGGGIQHTKKEMMTEMATEENFATAVRAALSVVAQREDLVPTDDGLTDCALLDMESIEMQNPEAWFGDHQQTAGPIEEIEDGAIRVALDLPLAGWLGAVRSAAGAAN